MDNKNSKFYIDKIKREQYFEMSQPHLHPFYELYYLVSGKRRIFVNDTIYEMEKGSLLLINKGDFHRTTYISSETHERFAIFFSEDYLIPLFNEFSYETIMNCFSQPYIIIPLQIRPIFEELMNKILNESQSQDLFSNYMRNTHFQELIIFIIRYQTSLLDYDNSTTIPSNDIDPSIQNTLKYIRKNFAQNITLEEAAKCANMSPTYFSKKFKQTTSFGFKEYLIKIRLAEASKKLIETTDSITDIAISCGFGDGNYFGDVFKKAKNISPLQYRKKKELF